MKENALSDLKFIEISTCLSIKKNNAKHWTKRLLVFLALSLALNPARAQSPCTSGLVYATNFWSQGSAGQGRGLFLIDPVTEAATLVEVNLFGGGAALAAGGVTETSAIALDIDHNVIWFVSYLGRIFSYNLNNNTHGTTSAGFAGNSGNTNKGAYNPVDKNVYFHESFNNHLFRFNPATPTVDAVDLGQLSVPGYSASLDFRGGDIAFDGLGNLTGFFATANIIAAFPAQYDANGNYTGLSLTGQKILDVAVQPSAAAFLPDGNYLVGDQRSTASGGTGTINVNSNTGVQTDLSTTNNFSASDFTSCAAPSPNLTLSMTATSSCTGNTTNFQYTIKVKNTGLFHALNTSVSETLPAGITLVSGTLNGAPIAGLTAATLASGIPLKSTNAVTDGQIFKGDSATIVLNCTAPSASATYTAQAFLRYNGIESLNLTNDRIPSNDPTTATVNDATSLTTVDCFIIDGTVFNDNNGTSGGADGSPLAGVTVTLYANDGITAIATSVTDASGHYSFPGLVHGDYIVGVTLPTGYRNVSSTDITPTNGQTAVTIGNLSVNGVNFGLNLPPTPVNDTLSAQIPGTVATVPNILSNDTDPNGGILSTDSITLIAPPGATNIITDAQGDVTGFTVPGEGVWSLNSSNGTVTFSPQTGFTDDPTPISYTVTDIAGLSSPSATITIDYNPPVVVSGTVFNDANGGTIDGTPTNAGGLNAILVNAAGDVVATVPVNALGEYTFSKVIPGNFSVRLSTVTGTVGQPAPAASLPANWTNTAEGTTATGDNTVDGSISLTVSNTPLSNVNFGIERLPESYPVNYSPTGAPTLTILNAQPLQGSDPEDQLTQGSWSGKSLVIDTLPTNGYILRYNGVAVTAGTPIPNYNPALLTIAPGATSAGTGTTTFKYATIDAAGKKDPTPAAYTVTWSIPLPAQLLTFTGSASKDCGFILDWTSGKEEQLSHFAVERSKDGMVFETIATVTPTGSNSTYHYTDNQVKGRMQYYRLRIVDVDHKEAYSKVLSLSNECGHTLSIYPNPVQDKVRIEGLTAAQTLVQIFNAEGRLMVEQTVKATSTELNIADLADGLYHFVITSDGRSQTMKVIKRK